MSAPSEFIRIACEERNSATEIRLSRGAAATATWIPAAVKAATTLGKLKNRALKAVQAESEMTVAKMLQ